jgi:hypothetical protein
MGRVLSYATYPAQTNWLLPVTTEPRNPDALRFTFHVLRRFLGGLPPDDMGREEVRKHYCTWPFI